MKKSILLSLALSFIGILIIGVILSVVATAAKPSEPVLKNLDNFLFSPIAYLSGGLVFGWYSMPKNSLREAITSGAIFAVLLATITKILTFGLQVAVFRAYYQHSSNPNMASISGALLVNSIGIGLLWSAWYIGGTWLGHQQCQRRLQSERLKEADASSKETVSE